MYYWKIKRISVIAVSNTEETLTRVTTAVNGGTKGIDVRRKYRDIAYKEFTK